MTPLQKVAMGLVIVMLDPRFGGYDGLPDVVGWTLVLSGLLALGSVLPDHATLRWLAVASGLVSLPLWFPGLEDQLDLSGQWAVSIPQAVFVTLLARSMAATVRPRSRLDVQPRRFRALFWVFLALVFAPAMVYGGQLDALLPGVAVIAVLSYAVLVWSLFALSRRSEYGGPVAAPVTGPIADANPDPDDDPTAEHG